MKKSERIKIGKNLFGSEMIKLKNIVIMETSFIITKILVFYLIPWNIYSILFLAIVVLVTCCYG